MSYALDQLKTRIKGKQLKGKVKATLTWLFDYYQYVRDYDEYGEPEFWARFNKSLEQNELCKGDCEDFGIVILELLWGLVGVDADDLALVITDVDRDDEKRFDHFVGAVRIDGDWFYFQCWDDQLHKEFIRGQEIVQYRRVDQKGWKTGSPQ